MDRFQTGEVSRDLQFEGTQQELEGARIMGQEAMRGTTVLETAPNILDLGMISDVEWGGPVSAKKLIDQGEVEDREIKAAIDDINNFYVDTNPTAKTRCIDGRHDPELDEAKLGPQVPGGAPGAALAYRLGVDKDDLTRGTFLADAESMISSYMRLGFAPGGHRDEHSRGESTVGCGAIDGMDRILATMTDASTVDDHKRVVKALLGKDFDRDSYLRVMGAALVLQGHSDVYFRDREQIIDILEKKVPESIATLKGDHQECIVAVNLVQDTTLASNRLSDSYKGLQAFGYDLWRSKEMAQRILPHVDQEEDRRRFVHARVMSTVATLMALTDGTQRLIIRTNE